MDKKTFDEQTEKLIENATNGDKDSLQELLSGIQDMVFNLSLRMLGTIPDAEDATQDILVRVMTKLSTFRKESAFTTWVYRLAVNYLTDYKKSMFAHAPLDFEFYGNDIRYAKLNEAEEIVDELTREALSEELKFSCTNVMLQCLDARSRCIFVMGTMFKLDSRTAAEILDMTPENYRQCLSRIRKKVAEFLEVHCGLAGSSICSCRKRVNYAVSRGRIRPDRLEYVKLHPLDRSTLSECKEEMEKLDALACSFEEFPYYQSTVSASSLVERLVNSEHLRRIQEF